jgi:GntR family transcriptional regulator
MPSAKQSIPQSRYRYVADKILWTIENKSYRDNDPLPSERELSEQYTVSRDTVRKAVRYLEERGVIYSDPGRGTFVAPAMVRRMSRFIDGFSQDTLQRGGKPGQRVLLLEPHAASLGMAGLLHVEPGFPLMRVKRLRSIDGAVVGLHDAYFSLPKGAILKAAEIERCESLYGLLDSKFGFAPAEALENLNASVADAEDASLLGIAAGTPILQCERITYSDRREPIEYCLMKYVQTYRYSARITRHSGGA